MKLGIKVGLRGDSKQDLIDSKPDFCEVWFHSGKIAEYDNLMAAATGQGIAVGLHFWGALPDNTLANLAYPNAETLKGSMKLVKNTIDYAAKYGCWYVNIHPGGAKLAKVNFETEQFIPVSESVPFTQAQQVLSESLTSLSQYAKARNVLLLVESVPKRAIGSPWTGKSGRAKPVSIDEIPLEYFDKFLNIDDVYFTNDFGHTGGNVISENRSEVIDYINQIAHKYQAKTRLLHVSYIISPYNGTDYHGCLYDDEFKTMDAVPNITEMKSLLSLFKDRSDVGALVEPARDHPGNFAFLKQLVASLT